MNRIVTVVTGLLFAAVAFADVQVQTVSRTSLIGGLGNMESNSKTGYQADKRAEARDFKMVGGIVGALSKGTQSTTEITRLDKDLIWGLDPKARTYTERPIALPTQEELAGAKVEAKTSGTPPPSRHRVTKSELKVEKTGKTKDVNAFPCTEYLLTWELELQDTATREKVGQLMTMDFWTTPLTEQLKKLKAAEEEFNRKMAKKLGAEITGEDMQFLGAGMLTATYGLDTKEAAAGMEKVSKEMAKIEGYPIVTEVTWKVKPDSAAMAKAKAEKEEEPEEKPTASFGGLGNLVANKIAKKLVKEPDPTKADVLFSSYMEVKSVAVADLPAGDFEVPEGYKKVEKK